MNYRTGCMMLVAGLTLTLLGCGQAGDASNVNAPTDATVKSLISQAASMSAETFQAVIARGRVTQDVQENFPPSLSLWLMLDETHTHNEEFVLANVAPDPAKLTAALVNGSRPVSKVVENKDGSRTMAMAYSVEYASFVWPDYITKIDTRNEAGAVIGVADFSVPDVYAGRLHFVLSDRDGTWTVTELSMPMSGILFRLDDQNEWQRVVD